MSYYDLKELSIVYEAIVYLKDEYAVDIPFFRGSSIDDVKLQVNLEIETLLAELEQDPNTNQERIEELKDYLLE